MGGYWSFGGADWLTAFGGTDWLAAFDVADWLAAPPPSGNGGAEPGRRHGRRRHSEIARRRARADSHPGRSLAIAME